MVAIFIVLCIFQGYILSSGLGCVGFVGRGKEEEGITTKGRACVLVRMRPQLHMILTTSIIGRLRYESW